MSLTARAFMFGEAERAPSALGHLLTERGALGVAGSALAGLSGPARTTVWNQLTASAAGLLDVDLGELLVAGWRRHTALQAAARATLANPAATEVVDLVTHRITSTHQPYLELVAAGQRVASLRFTLSLAFEIAGLVATVQRGSLIGLQCGRCRIEGVLSCEDVELARREGELDARLMIPLATEIPLVAHARVPT